ncbi:MAG: pyridoxal phosphate-dependent aminotransferase [Alphaproteobacteria bacterium]|nr:pyridoxal phosphate-dependent aminotransferase [Alphaproteobacteria bacterium]
MAQDGAFAAPKHEAELFPLEARATARALEASRIREIANPNFGVPGLARFWVGEGNEPTPAFIRDAAARALAEGQTFYTHNRGVQELRDALGDYLREVRGLNPHPDQLSITSGGVNALMIAMQALVDPGDEVVAVTPVWPNLTQIPRILGARVRRVGLRPGDGAWRLDLDELLDAITPATRLVLVNSPNNPTGWTLPVEAARALLAHCRRLGVWVLSDDVYERLDFDGEAASLLALAEPGDRVISANSFSKAWRMTGWRLGWLVAPAALEPEIGKLLEYNTSCAPDFIQAGAIVALREGEAHVQDLHARLIARRDRMARSLRALDGIEVTRPQGGMYILLRVRGFDDSVALAKRLIAEVGLGLAPGVAFGPEGEGWLRWCIAAADAGLDDGVARLTRWLEARPRP